MAALVFTLAVAAYQPMFPGSGYPAASKESLQIPVGEPSDRHHLKVYLITVYLSKV